MKFFAWSFVLVILFSTSCKRDPLKIPISKIDLELNVLRFEKDLFTIDVDSISTQLPVLKDTYKDFLPLFGYIINIGSPDNPLYPEFIKSFISDRINREVYEFTMETFNGFEKYKEDLVRAFKHYHYHFPERPVPNIYTFISRFNASIILDTNLIGIGLDRYLGSDYKPYENLGLPFYQRQKMHPDKMISDCMYAWGSSEFPIKVDQQQDFTDNVLNNMIYEGKLMYFVEAMMPVLDDSQVIGFTSEQIKWCINNEGLMWTFLIENDLLFNTDHLTIRKLTGDAPYTSYFPRESPGRASVWVGWQIIRSYMEKHPETSLNDLMRNSNYQELLNNSNYNPR